MCVEINPINSKYCFVVSSKRLANLEFSQIWSSLQFTFRLEPGVKHRAQQRWICRWGEGHRGCASLQPMSVQLYSFYAVFSENRTNKGLATPPPPPFGFVLPIWEFLDPPLLRKVCEKLLTSISYIKVQLKIHNKIKQCSTN